MNCLSTSPTIAMSTTAPGLMLIGHEADYSLDQTDGVLGLRYNRKAPLAGTNLDRLIQATRAALVAAQRWKQMHELNES